MPNLSNRIVFGLIAVQIAIPALALGVRWMDEGSHPVREYPLSWQMYSAADVGHFSGTTQAGYVKELATDALPVLVRGVGYGETVEHLLCESNPDIVTVRRETTNRSLSPVEFAC